MHYEQHIKNLTAEDTCSAQKAVDYLDGYHRPYLEKMLDDVNNGGIKQWRKRGVKPVWENILGLIVERSAKTYQDQPRRVIMLNGEESKDATDTYNALLVNSNFRAASQDLDQLSRLLKTAVIIPQWIDETSEFLFSVVSRNNCDVDLDHKTGEIKSVCYTAGSCGPNGGRMYHYWDGVQIIDLEQERDGGACVIVGREENPYGIVPAAFRFDIRRPRYSVWAKPAWEQLTYLNEVVSMFHIEMRMNQRHQSFGTLFTNAQIPDGFAAGPDTYVQLDLNPGETPFIEYKAPSSISVAIKAFNDWMDEFKRTVSDSWGVNLEVGGGGTANSGFQLVVEEFASLELMQKRINSAKDFERQLYTVMARMSEVHNLGLPAEGNLTVDFDEPSLPVNKKEDWDIWKEKIALGVKTLRDYWKWENPDLTDEQLDQMEADRNRTNSARVPEFSEGN